MFQGLDYFRLVCLHRFPQLQAFFNLHITPLSRGAKSAPVSVPYLCTLQARVTWRIITMLRIWLEHMHIHFQLRKPTNQWKVGALPPSSGVSVQPLSTAVT